MAGENEIKRLIGAVDKRFPYARWFAWAWIVVQSIAVAWRGLSFMIDTYTNAQFLARHQEQAINLAKSIVVALFSPTGSILTLILGFGFLILDRRYGSSSAPVALPAPDGQQEQEIEGHPGEQSVEEKQDIPSPPAETISEDDFPLKLEWRLVPIIKQDRGGYDFGLSATAKGDALVASFTNENLVMHSVAARIIYYAERKSMYERYGKRLRVIARPLWLGEIYIRAGIDIGVHDTQCLVLAVQNRPPYDSNLASVEDHRYTDNSALGVEARALERRKTSIEVELILDGSRKKTFGLSVNFKTFSLSPKERGKLPNEKKKL